MPSAVSLPRIAASRADRPAVLLAVVAAVIIGVVFSAHVDHYAFLGDDAFISFRYARNLVDGHGLVWNIGERVEGYTNFLWVMLMAGGISLGVRPEIFSQGLGITCGALVLVLTALYAGRSYGWRNPLIWLVPAALALNRSFVAWCTGGLETQLFTLLVVAGFVAFAHQLHQYGAPRPSSAVLFALATLCRPDGAVFAFAVALCLLFRVARTRLGLVALVRWSLAYLVPTVTHLVWRFSYYGEWLPNTYFAKLNEAGWSRAAIYFRHFESDYHLAVLLLLVPLALVGKRMLENSAMLIATTLYCLSVAYAGGDRFGFRLLVPCLPFVYLLIAASIHRIFRIAREREPQRRRLQIAGVVVALALLGATSHGSWRPEANGIRDGIASVEKVSEYAESRIRQGKTLLSFVETGQLPADLTLGVGGAGAVPYYTRWKSIDYLGLNDHHVARQATVEKGLIGHQHHATLQYMRDRGVEIFDLANGLVMHNRRETLRKEMPRVQRKAARFNARSAKRGSTVRIYPECRALSKDWALVVGRISTEDEFRERFGHLESCR